MEVDEGRWGSKSRTKVSGSDWSSMPNDQYAPLLGDRPTFSSSLNSFEAKNYDERSVRPRFIAAAGSYTLYILLIVIAATIAFYVEKSIPGAPLPIDVFNETRALANLGDLIYLSKQRNGVPVPDRMLYGITGRLAMTDSGLDTAAWVQDKLAEINADVLSLGGTRQMEIVTRTHDGAVVEDDDSSAMWYSGVTNVLARIPGASPRALLISAHYDTVAYSPGASDNGAAVVTVLEILRELLSIEELPYTVIALFDDAEESGLLGAFSFAAYAALAHCRLVNFVL